MKEVCFVLLTKWECKCRLLRARFKVADEISATNCDTQMITRTETEAKRALDTFCSKFKSPRHHRVAFPYCSFNPELYV